MVAGICDEARPQRAAMQSLAFDATSAFSSDLIGAMESSKRTWEEVWDRNITLELRAEIDGVVASKPSARKSLVLSVLQRADARTGEALAFKLVLSSEADLFFVFEATLEPRQYALLQEAQGLTTPFHELPRLLAALADRCDRAPAAFFAVLLLSGCGERARLDFVQDLDFKFVELASLAFAACPDRVVRRAASARYHAARRRAAGLAAQLEGLAAAVKQRNPGLLVQFEQRWGAAAGGERERPAAPEAQPASPAAAAAGAPQAGARGGQSPAVSAAVAAACFGEHPPAGGKAGGAGAGAGAGAGRSPGAARGVGAGVGVAAGTGAWLYD
ncbi:MAG: hypothetical protein J3K34DRAFT_524690 [Monoraphidium minutum]|nr:MAG: hypothetical protein J3K34DRAFT_524690 [Monoraphidium minutum]